MYFLKDLERQQILDRVLIFWSKYISSYYIELLSLSILGIAHGLHEQVV